VRPWVCSLDFTSGRIVEVKRIGLEDECRVESGRVKAGRYGTVYGSMVELEFEVELEVEVVCRRRGYTSRARLVFERRVCT
jgi:hypothetical protein